MHCFPRKWRVWGKGNFTAWGKILAFPREGQFTSSLFFLPQKMFGVGWTILRDIGSLRAPRPVWACERTTWTQGSLTRTRSRFSLSLTQKPTRFNDGCGRPGGPYADPDRSGTVFWHETTPQFASRPSWKTDLVTASSTSPLSLCVSILNLLWQASVTVESHEWY